MWLGKVVFVGLWLWLLPSIAIRHQKVNPFSARVIRITDGDTLEVLYGGKPLKIRLAYIDSPEKKRKQPYGDKAKNVLAVLCFNQKVKIYPQKHDRYKRLIAVLINDKGQNVNQEMIRLGMAWHYKKYSSDPIYAKLEIEARKKHIGLWQDKNAIPPWYWRK
ncbi:Thermonuclease [compost metagenome]